MPFIDLDDDVLLLIIENLLYSSRTLGDLSFGATPSNRSLRSLSATSRHLRNILLPTLFRKIQWPRPDNCGTISTFWREGDFPDIPADVSRHVRRLLVCSDSKLDVVAFLQNIGDMPNLVHVLFDCTNTIPSSVLSYVIRRPSIVALEILQTPMELMADLHITSSLTSLSIKPATTFVRFDGGPPINDSTSEVKFGVRQYNQLAAKALLARNRLSFELDVSHRLVMANSTRLQCLEINGQYLSLQMLQNTHFTSLQTLTFTNCVPETLGTSVIAVLWAPTLLELHFKLSWNGSSYRIIPSTCQLITSETIHGLFPLLHTLTISNASPDDLIFCNLPASIKHVHMPTIRDVHTSKFGLTPSAAAQIVQSMFCSQASLLTLHLSLMQLPLPSLIELIASKFPDLQHLELPTSSYMCPQALHQPWEAYQNALAPLSLKTLRLAAYFEDDGRQKKLRIAQELKYAGAAAAALPTLESISFQRVREVIVYGGRDRHNVWDQYEIDSDRCFSIKAQSDQY